MYKTLAVVQTLWQCGTGGISSDPAPLKQRQAYHPALESLERTADTIAILLTALGEPGLPAEVVSDPQPPPLTAGQRCWAAP